MALSLFGTDGIRAQVGTYPFTQDALHTLGRAIGTWTRKTYSDGATIIIGHDTRESCDWVVAALSSGILLEGITIRTVDIVSTPALCLLTKYNELHSAGIMISASHNPYQDNGIKIVDHQGTKISSQAEQAITKVFHTHNNTQNKPEPFSFGSSIRCPEALDIYTDTVCSFFPDNFLRNKIIVLDCANGATYRLALSIFKKLGATVHLLNAEPNGININDNCGALHPARLQQAVTDLQADMGFAFDGDGDRVMAVNKYGELKDGDDILALLLTHPLYSATPTVVGTVMTNQGFAAHVASLNKKLMRTNVGDKHIARALHTENLMLGGEQSGHIIMRDFINTGDGIFTALRVAQAVVHTNNVEMKTFEKYPQVLINVPIKTKKDLTLPPLSELIATTQSQLDTGRVLVRYSGTENVVRVMIEDTQHDHATMLGTSLSQALRLALNS